MFNNQYNLGGLTQMMFRPVDGVVWDMMTGKLGFQTDEGIATLEGTGEDARVNVNLMSEFGVAIPAFAQSTQQDKVAEGDLIITGANKIMWVVERIEKEGSVRFKTMKVSGESGSWTPPRKTVMGFDTGVLVLRSLTNMFQTAGGPAATNGMANMQQMLMFMGMFGSNEDGSVDGGMLKRMMPMILMGAMNGDGAANSTGPMMQMLQMQMFQQMMNGGGNGGNVFGGNQSAQRPNQNAFNNLRPRNNSY